MACKALMDIESQHLRTMVTSGPDQPKQFLLLDEINAWKQSGWLARQSAVLDRLMANVSLSIILSVPLTNAGDQHGD